MSAAVTGVLVAVVAGVFGLGGAVLTAHRDHERWLGQARLDAYATLLACATNLTTVHARLLKVRQDPRTAVPDEVARQHLFARVDAYGELRRAEALVHLVGPDTMDPVAEDLASAALAHAFGLDDDETEPAELLERVQCEFVRTARAALASRQRIRWWPTKGIRPESVAAPTPHAA